jgi:hypothetical protein
MRGSVLVVVSGSLFVGLVRNGCRTMPKGNHLAKLLPVVVYTIKKQLHGVVSDFQLAPYSSVKIPARCLYERKKAAPKRGGL